MPVVSPLRDLIGVSRVVTLSKTPLHFRGTFRETLTRVAAPLVRLNTEPSVCVWCQRMTDTESWLSCVERKALPISSCRTARCPFIKQDTCQRGSRKNISDEEIKEVFQEPRFFFTLGRGRIVGEEMEQACHPVILPPFLGKHLKIHCIKGADIMSHFCNNDRFT